MAQGTGKIEGRVVDAASGRPLVGAQVTILGTHFGNITNEDGYYFINNVPAGLHDIQAQYIGYQPMTVAQQRVLAGQTMDVSFRLSQSAVQIEAIEVVGERAPLVPRDQVASKNIVTGETVQDLPVDDVREVLALQPGVVDNDLVHGVSIRGGRSGEEAVYIDGVLVRNFNWGRADLQVGTNTLSEVDVLTGGFSAEYGEAQSGVINYVTRAGGRTWNGAFSFQTDEIIPKEYSVGLNRLEASLGGPIWGAFSFFGALTAQGQRSMNTGKLWRDVPIYVVDGVEDVVTIPTGVVGSDTAYRNVVIPKFVRYDEGGRYPYTARDEYTLDGKIDFSYGAGSRVFLSGKASRSQSRDREVAHLFNQMGRTGVLNKSSALILGWTHNFVQSADHALALDVKLAMMKNRYVASAIDPQWQLDHASPFMGFTFADMEFVVDDKDFPVNQQLVDNWISNTGQRTPFLNRTDLRSTQEFRLNPWGVATGFYLSGLGGDFTNTREDQLQARVSVDWQANRYNRFKFGGDWTNIDLAAALLPWTTQNFGEVWVENPTRMSAYVQDRIDLGDLVIEAGLRYDRFDPKSRFPVVPGYFRPDEPEDFMDAPVQAVWSPRLGVSFPVTENSTFRLSYGHFAQVPDLNEYYQGKNLEYFTYKITNTNDYFARPLEMGKTIAFEFGFRQLLGPDFVLDISAYNKDKLADVALRKLPYNDPTRPGAVTWLNTFTNADYGTIRGVDVRVDRRFGRLLDVMGGYSYQDARGTGTDPYTYADVFARTESSAATLLGQPTNPAQAIRPIEENRVHNISGNFVFHVPADYEEFPAWARNVALTGTVRFASGLPYTRVTGVGSDYVVGPPTDLGLSGTLRYDDISTNRMPWRKLVDMKISKGVEFAGMNTHLFADIRNLFDFDNWNLVFLTSGDIVDEEFYSKRIDEYISTLGNRNVDLTSLATASPSVTNEVDLRALRAVEERFAIGEPDGIFTLDEQRRAFREATLFNWGPQWHVDTGRRIRLGIEVAF